MSKCRKNFICMVLMLILSMSFKTEIAYANEANSQQEVLENYDLSTVEYKLFDGNEYYAYSKKGVTYNGRSYKVVVSGLPNGVTATCVGDNQVNAGDYKVTIKFSHDDKHNPIPDKEISLRINKAVKDMSQVEFYDSNIAYDGKIHHMYATNIPSNVGVLWYKGNGVKKAGSNPITAYFYLKGKDAANYEPIKPITAMLNIVDKKDPKKLNYDESNIEFKNIIVPYDAKEHSLCATGVPEGVEVFYTGNRKKLIQEHML